MKVLVFDSENNGLIDHFNDKGEYHTVSKMWCIAGVDVETEQRFSFGPDQLDDALEFLATYDVLIGHNIIEYDFRVFKMLKGWEYHGKVIDTLVLSRYLMPERVGGHTIEAWGKRVGHFKPSHDDWSQFSPEMLHRCEEDAYINLLVFNVLCEEVRQRNKGNMVIDGVYLWGPKVVIPEFKKGDRQAFWCESHVQRIIADQMTRGVNFDVELAHKNIEVLEQTRDELYATIRPHLSLEVVRPYDKPVAEPFKKDGDYNARVIAWMGDNTSHVSGPFSRVEFVEPDLGSRTKLIAQLLRLGWKPTAYTPRTEKGGGGNPKLTVDGDPCPNLMILTGVGGEIAKWYIATHRQSQIKGWLRKLRPDGRLTAGANTIGTPTYRFTHKTVVNVPKAAKQVWFGALMRALFIASEGRVFIGHDGSGLELRMLAHYINDEDYTFAVVYGRQEDGTDVHTKNKEMAGLPTRDDAKTFIYAFIYGAGDGKLGVIVSGTLADGKRLRAQFLQANPKLAELIKGVKGAAARGFLVGLDGRRIYLRRDKLGRLQIHKSLNTLLQTAGAVVMKYSMVWLDIHAQACGLDAWKVIDMHDEGQADVADSDAEAYAQLAERSVQWAGEYLQMDVPLAAEAKVGSNWAETH